MHAVNASDFSRLFNPRGIAVIGASADMGRIGGQPIFALTEFGYTGKVYPVNPKYNEIKGLFCYQDVASVPQPCDVALIALPAKMVPQAIRDCGNHGIPYAIILSAGFREIGEPGLQMQAELDHAIAISGIRVIGPNCQGLMNIRGNVYCGFGAPFQNDHPRSGPVALVTQSGGFGYAVLGLAEHAGVGFNYAVSTGNEADIDTLDLLAWLLEQGDVEVVSTYMEGITDGRRLIELGRRALELGKPIVVWKVGNSATGRVAAASHTANLSAGYELYRAAFRQGGFVEVRDVDDLVDVSKAFRHGRLPRGENVAIISISGGAGVLLADRCEELGLKLPPVSPQSLDELRTFMPAFASLTNPIDVTAQIFNDLEMFRRVLSIVLTDSEIDQVVVYNASIQGATAERLARELVAIAATTTKPILVASSAIPGKASAALDILAQHNLPCYSTPGRAASAAASLCEFARRKRRPRESSPVARLLPLQPFNFAERPTMLSERRSKQCLTAYGIPVVRDMLLTVDNALALRESPMAFPLVVKLESPDLPHKTEAGAVRIGIGNLTELKLAVSEMLKAACKYKPDARIEGVSLQEMANGLEVIAGAINDPYFGPVVAFGLGGIFTELLHDVTHRFAPFGVDTAREMVHEIKGSVLLTGFRGQPTLDIDALAQALSRLSFLIADHAGRIEEIDINPLFVRETGRGVVAADALVVLRDLKQPPSNRLKAEIT